MTVAPLLASQMWDAPGAGWAMVGAAATVVMALLALVGHLRRLRQERAKALAEAQAKHDEEVRTKAIAEQLATAQKEQVRELVDGQSEILKAVTSHGTALDELGRSVKEIGQQGKATADDLHSHVETSNAQLAAIAKRVDAHEDVIKQIPAFAKDLKFVKDKLTSFGRSKPERKQA